MLHSFPLLLLEEMCNILYKLSFEEPAFNMHTNYPKRSVLNPFILV